MRSILFTFLVILLTVCEQADAQPMFNRDYNSPGQACAWATHVQTQDGGMALLAHMFDISGPTQAAVVYRTDAIGNLQWETHISLSAGIQSLSNLVRSPDSSYFFVSNEYGPGYNAYLVNASGSVVFANAITVPAPWFNLATPVCFARNDGTFLVATTLYDQSSSRYAWTVMNIDHTGNIIWSKIYNESQIKTYHHDIDTTANGDIVLLAESKDTSAVVFGPCLLRIAPNGILLWSKSWFSATVSMMPQQLSVMPGDFIFVSSYTTHPTTGYFETCISRFTGQGNELWTLKYGGPKLYPHDLIANGDHLLVLGESVYDGFLIEMDSSGIVLWGKNYDGNSSSNIAHSGICGYTITSSAPVTGMRVFSAGLNGSACVDSTIDLTKTPVNVVQTVFGNDTVLNCTVSQAVFSVLNNPSLVTTNCFQSGIEESEIAPTVFLYPNPASGSVTISCDAPVKYIEIYNLTGQLVQQKVNLMHETIFDVSGLAEGVYHLQIETENRIESRRLIIQK